MGGSECSRGGARYKAERALFFLLCASASRLPKLPPEPSDLVRRATRRRKSTARALHLLGYFIAVPMITGLIGLGIGFVTGYGVRALVPDNRYFQASGHMSQSVRLRRTQYGICFRLPLPRHAEIRCRCNRGRRPHGRAGVRLSAACSVVPGCHTLGTSPWSRCSGKQRLSEE
jgi:hypothetical protein